MRFIDKYVRRAVGNHILSLWIKLNRSKNLLDKITASDIAYSIIVYENTKDVWEEELQIKATAKNPDERRKAQRHQKPKYHEGRGKRLKRFHDGWTKQGREYYKELCVLFRNLKAHDCWTELQENWKIYQKKTYNVSNDMANDGFENDGIEEEEDSDEDDWRVNTDDIKETQEVDMDSSDIESDDNMSDDMRSEDSRHVQKRRRRVKEI